jgi:hypothetical protein
MPVARVNGEELGDEDLAEIARRADAATPAPWYSWVEGRDGVAGESFIQTGGSSDGDSPDIYVTHSFRKGSASMPANANDLDFIAAAREDVPRLVAEVQRLRRLLEEGQ